MTLMTNVPFKPLDSWTVKGSELQQLQTPPSNQQPSVSSFLPSSACWVWSAVQQRGGARVVHYSVVWHREEICLSECSRIQSTGYVMTTLNI